MSPTNPATITTTGISSIEPITLIAEQWGFVDKYCWINDITEDLEPEGLLDDARVEFGKIFVVSYTSPELTAFICAEATAHGTGYEFLSLLNDRGLVSLARATQNKARESDENSSSATGRPRISTLWRSKQPPSSPLSVRRQHVANVLSRRRTPRPGGMWR